jgi:hypothetical protein
VFDLKLNYATTGCMGNGISAPDRIELVDQRTDVELGRMDRYAKTASYCLVGQREELTPPIREELKAHRPLLVQTRR